ncbi:MAG: phosphomannomutase/phosphoglucomutase [Planctomycetes bacterium]|nr:phosphomannomutase/phosphoglucomutase [Planctomycetota bacterium]
MSGSVRCLVVDDVVQRVDSYYRYCPGEERLKISDAVCLGRRRSNFPKCKGCQFNDDEKRAAAAGGERRAETGRADGDKIESLFGAYDLRGTYPDPLDADVAWRVGLATAQFLRSQLRGYDRSERAKSTVVVGRDMRRSSVALAEALIEGLRAGGSPVVDIGLIDTPQLYFAVNRVTCCGGVQVTASHNPPNYNGFKICGQKAKPISSDTGLLQICKIAQNTLRHQSGQLADLRQEDLSEAYRDFVRGFFNAGGGCFNAERPLKVVVDASNGMAGRWVPLLFGDVEWLDIVRLNFEHNGEFIHEPNPLVEANLAQLKDRMGRSKADLGVCFDGDADRLITVDEKGRTIPADLITALLARTFLGRSAGSVVVYDLRSSRAVAEEVRDAGGVPRRERCGHAFIKKMLADTKGIFAGEVSGQYYFRDNFYCDSGMIAFAEVLNLLAATGKPIGELVAPLRRYAGSGEINFLNDDTHGTLKWLAAQHSDGEIDYLDGVTVQYHDWWFNVRPSNTEPRLLRLNVEAADERLLARRLAELSAMLGSRVEE